MPATTRPRRSRARRFIRFAFLALAAGVIAWQLWMYAPIPAYVPRDAGWQCLARHSRRAWGRPCVYARFEVSRPGPEVIPELREAISAHCNAQRFTERTSEELLAEVGKRWPPDEPIPDDELIRRVIPVLGQRHALSTNSPFVVLSWFGHEEPATHRYIVTRVIDTGPGTCTVELWDYRALDH